MKRLLILFTLAFVMPRAGRRQAPRIAKPGPEIERQAQLAKAQKAAKEASIEAQLQADKLRVEEIKASPEAKTWPEWLSVALVTGGVAVAVGPELFTYYGLTAAADMTTAEVAALAFDAAQVVYAASQGAKSHIANVSSILYQVATTPAQANFLRLLQSQLEGQGLSWIVQAALR